MKKVLITSVAALLCSIAFNGAALAAEGTVNSKIKNMYYYEGHNGLLLILQTMSDLGGCGNANWYLLPISHPRYTEMTALLMAARFADKEVQITVNGCAEGYGRVKHLMLLP